MAEIQKSRNSGDVPRPRRKEGRRRAQEPVDPSARETAWLARIPEENPDPVFRVSAEHVLLYNNPAGEKLRRAWGCRLGQKVPTAIRTIVSAALADGAVVRRKVAFAAHTYALTAAPSAIDGYVNIYARDITDCERAQAALRQAEQRFRTIFEATSDGIFLHDLETRKLTMCNQAFLRMLGYTEQESAQLSIADIHPEADLPFIYAQIEKFLQGDKPIRHDIRFQRKDGSILFADVSPDLVQLEGRRHVVVALKDITERKRTEEELRHTVGRLQQLTLELSQAEDRERRRIADILHDDVQQTLAAAKFHLNLLCAEPRSAPESREIIAQVKAMLKDAIEKSRRLSHELSPALHQVDLPAILEWLARQMREKHGLTVRVEVRGAIESPSERLKVFLYKVVQELLFNVVKHAGVRAARVRLRQHGPYLRLAVVDKGRGFDLHQLEAAPGFGLLGIRERVQLLGGRMKIKSAPGAGSTLLIALPCEPAASAQAAAPAEYQDALTLP